MTKPRSRRSANSAGASAVTPIREVQAEAERAAILNALAQTGNNKAQAALLLGIHRTLLYKKMKRYDISLTPES